MTVALVALVAAVAAVTALVIVIALLLRALTAANRLAVDTALAAGDASKLAMLHRATPTRQPRTKEPDYTAPDLSEVP